jgi:hypothetical protein
MKISGFTIIKNALVNDYPIKEAILSVLPMVDEMVVLVGDCSDETRALITGIDSSKIKIFDSVWDPAVRTGGTVLAVETDKAFQLIDKESDWAFYIQADEVIHEKYHAAILEGCRKYKDDKQVEGLLFKYLHFYGTYDYVGDSRTWYTHEVRIIRNDKKIRSYKDAQGFRVGSRKLNVKPLDAAVYHYGWVKNPAQMKRKMKEAGKLWHEDTDDWKAFLQTEDFFDYNGDFDSLRKFEGTHPAVMQSRINNKDWEVALDISKKRLSFKDRLLYYFEKLTGIRPFTFTNYKIIR